MASQEPEVSFKITDRRRRAESEEAEPAQPASDRPPASGPDPRAGANPAPSSADPRRSLVGLFTMLGRSALIALGEAEDATLGDEELDLPGAADLIDLLVLLREKTQGHRSAEETQVLDDLLYDLQMRYVNATRRFG
jgi:hypothetical protein